MEGKKKHTPQTNRTILFEEINPEQLDLLTLLREDATVSLNDDKIHEINSVLLVKSFDEFMERFQPVLYGVYDTVQNKMKFTQKKPAIPEALIKVIPLDQSNGFLEMMLNLMDEQIEKTKSGRHFHFERMLNIVLPERMLGKLKTVRSGILKKFRDYAKTSAEEIEKKQHCLNEIHQMLDAEMYCYHDILSLLPLAMEDLKTKLFPKKQRTVAWNPIVDGISNMHERDLRVLDLPEQGSFAVADLAAADQQELKELIRYHCQKNLHQIGTYVEQLVLRSYGLEPADEELEIEQLAEQYNQYLEFYTESCCSLIESAKPVFEKILGVKAFFDQYQVEQPGMTPELLVTNVNNDLWVDYQKAERLHTFLNTVNCKTNYDNTIWFAILPNLTFPPDKEKKLSRMRFKGNEVRNIARTNSMTLAANIMNVLAKYQIQTFFGFENDESTTFSYTAKQGISHYQAGCRQFIGQTYSEFSIPCFPNFTLIPKEKSYLVAGKKIIVTAEKRTSYSEQREDLCRIFMGGMHLEAAYVAAGMTAAWQCPEYLRERYPKATLENFPGVRYDIEEDNHRIYTMTTLGREITGYSQELLNEVERQKFGFFFSVENHLQVANGKMLPNNVTIISARSLGKKDGQYDNIFKILTTNYIERVFRYSTLDYKKSEIIRFFRNHSNSIFSQWRAGNKYINGILQRDDQLDYQLDEQNNLCVLELAFGDDVRRKEIDLTPYMLEEEGE